MGVHSVGSWEVSDRESYHDAPHLLIFGVSLDIDNPELPFGLPRQTKPGAKPKPKKSTSRPIPTPEQVQQPPAPRPPQPSPKPTSKLVYVRAWWRRWLDSTPAKTITFTAAVFALCMPLSGSCSCPAGPVADLSPAQERPGLDLTDERAWTPVSTVIDDARKLVAPALQCRPHLVRAATVLAVDACDPFGRVIEDAADLTSASPAR